MISDSRTMSTPGPWCKENYEGHDIVDVYDAAGFRVASCHYYAPHQDRRAFSTCDEHIEREDGACQANASLIAAAPDMLAALRRASSFILCNGYDTQDQALLNEVSDAIAKAEGRSVTSHKRQAE